MTPTEIDNHLQRYINVLDGQLADVWYDIRHTVEFEGDSAADFLALVRDAKAADRVLDLAARQYSANTSPLDKHLALRSVLESIINLHWPQVEKMASDLDVDEADAVNLWNKHREYYRVLGAVNQTGIEMVASHE